MAEAIERKVLEGINLILSVGGAALGFSTTCKIDTTAEFGVRVTKEAASGEWEEGYLKELPVPRLAGSIACATETSALARQPEVTKVSM